MKMEHAWTTTIFKKSFTGCPSGSKYTVSNASVDIAEFLQLQKSGYPVVDARTPAEFQSGHIPGAINLPLFNDEERKVIGTIYKQNGREKAILHGLKFVGPRLKELAEYGLDISDSGEEHKVLIHCWRGGMRSSSLAWLFNLMGIRTCTLRRGYKTFRKYVTDTFQTPVPLTVLGGKTGSAKTLILGELQKQGEQVIDLEGLAYHRGSAFGAIYNMGQRGHVTQEQFENNLAMIMRACTPEKPVWIEDESRQVGSIVIPAGLWENMRSSRVMYLDIPRDIRTSYLVNQYGQDEVHLLKQSFTDIKKRLGDVRYQEALSAMESNDLHGACNIALDYYDRAYEFGLSKRQSSFIKKIKLETIDVAMVTGILLESVYEGNQINQI